LNRTRSPRREGGTTQAAPSAHAADRLLASIARVGSPACVGIDPVIERLPRALRDGAATRADQAHAIGAYAEGVIEAVAKHVPCVKLQSACFERYGWEGVAALERCIKAARRAGLAVILDAKRGDIGVSAEHYAAGAFDGPGDSHADWITINPYLGDDGIRPFLRERTGAFALVRTSNPGGDAVQTARLAGGRSIAEHIASIVASIGDGFIGVGGYSALGAVVGATRPEAADALRRLMPRQLFLVPGFGAQGGSVEDVLPCFKPDGTGAIVTASRSVIFSFGRDDGAWQRAVGDSAAAFADSIRTVLRRG